jgi:hypothetical protein
MISNSDYVQEIQKHYEEGWHTGSRSLRWQKGPIAELPENFSVLMFDPSASRSMYTYATCGMSLPSDAEPLELHLFAGEEAFHLIELLTVVAHYHRTGSFLRLGDTVNFGRPWVPGSACGYGLISRPYLDGPQLEWQSVGEIRIRFLWVIPITYSEREYKKKFGLEALETRFEAAGFDYSNPYRESVV